MHSGIAFSLRFGPVFMSEVKMSQMRVLLTQNYSKGRKENDQFTDSTNEIAAEAGSKGICRESTDR